MHARQAAAPNALGLGHAKRGLALLASTILLTALCACSKRQPVGSAPPRPRGIGGPVAVEPGAAPSEAVPVAPEREPLLPLADLPPGPATKPKPDAGKRDFERELTAGMGMPIQCLKPRKTDEAPAQIPIFVTVMVMPSGAVSRSEVSGSGLDGDELACIRSLAERVSFPPPIEDAPFAVHATIKLQQQAQPKAAPTAAAVDEPKPLDTEHPAAPAAEYQPAAPAQYKEVPGEQPAAAPPAQYHEAAPTPYPEAPPTPPQ